MQEPGIAIQNIGGRVFSGATLKHARSAAHIMWGLGRLTLS
jgi:hypothetical protein